MTKTDRLVIRITPELKSQLQAAAEAEGGAAIDLVVYPVATRVAAA